ncbi:MAG: S24/S26 family peptidase [Clostridia bacterium]|nr:S24/S26 family peptidase [Clostridia bacterium]
MDSFVYFKILKNGFDKYPDITYRLSVTGESMLPTLKNGQRITIASKKDISIGDIILFCKFNDHFTLHRVVKILNIDNKIYYQTKGDGYNKIDNYFHYY